MKPADTTYGLTFHHHHHLNVSFSLMTGILFGQPSRSLQQLSISELLVFLPGENSRDFLKRLGALPAQQTNVTDEAPDRRLGKGADLRPGVLKSSGPSSRGLTVASVPRIIQGKHSDGQPLWLMCQVSAKETTGTLGEELGEVVSD